MALTTYEQFKQFIAFGDSFAIACGAGPAWDNLSAGLALALYLASQNKKVNIYSDQISEAPKVLQNFWPAAQTSSAGAEIILDIAQTGLASVQYQVVDNKLRIMVAPKTGAISAESVSVKTADDNLEKIIALGLPDFDSLSRLIKLPATAWPDKSILNIDNDPANEIWGAYNVVEPLAVSVSQMTAQFLLGFMDNFVSADMASVLAYGLMGASKNTTKKNWDALQEILERLQKKGGRLLLTETVEVATPQAALNLPGLQLWGRALARLKKINNIWLTVVADADLEKTQSAVSDMESFDKHLEAGFFGGRPLVVLVENSGQNEIKIFGDKNILAGKIITGIIPADSLRDAYRIIVEKISDLK